MLDIARLRSASLACIALCSACSSAGDDVSAAEQPESSSESLTAGGRSVVVPRDFRTIQAALDAADPGATIKILPGEYREQLSITKDVVLKGAGATSDCTLPSLPAAVRFTTTASSTIATSV